MAAPVLDYTTHEEVRSLLGVGEKELANETIELEVYYTGLLEDLYEINPKALQTFADLPDSGLTPAQDRYKRLVRQFSSYSVAKQLGNSMPMFAPRSIGDGKANVARFIDPYQKTLKQIEAGFDQSRDRLVDALDDLLAEERPEQGRTLFLAVGLARDPVTSGG